MKIKITCGWDTCENITQRLADQFLTPEFVDKFELVYGDDYEVIVFNNYITEDPKKNTKSIIFFHEPTWSGNHQKNFNYPFDLTILGFDRDNYSIVGNKFKESCSKMFYGGRGPWTEGHNFWTYRNLTSLSFKKTSNISSTVSNLGMDGNFGPQGCLYEDRVNLLTELVEQVEYVDFYGWTGKKENIKGQVKEKKQGLVNYMFSLSIENSNEKNYISEKFFDCILTDTVPVYYGCNNIQDLIPENCYIKLDNITDVTYVKECLRYINDNAKTLYEKMKPELLKFKKRYWTDFNPLTNLLEI